MGPTWVLSAPDGPMLAPGTLLSGNTACVNGINHIFCKWITGSASSSQWYPSPHGCVYLNLVMTNVIKVSGLYYPPTECPIVAIVEQMWTCQNEIYPWFMSSRAYFTKNNAMTKDYSGYGLWKWEVTLQCNVVSHCLSPYPEWSMHGY